MEFQFVSISLVILFIRAKSFLKRTKHLESSKTNRGIFLCYFVMGRENDFVKMFCASESRGKIKLARIYSTGVEVAIPLVLPLFLLVTHSSAIEFFLCVERLLENYLLMTSCVLGVDTKDNVV